MYARNDVEVVRRPDLESPTIESLWIEVCPPKSHSFLVGVLYRPPTASNHAVKDYMFILESGLQQAAARGKEVIILGDLNCDLLAKRNNTSVECRQLKGLLRSENFTQLIHQPTRITRDSQTLLDIIATNAPHNIKESGVLSLSLSDHDFVYCIRKLNWVKTPPEVKCFRNYAKYDPSKFCDDLRNVDWNANENSHDETNVNNVCVDNAWSRFKAIFLQVADRHAPFIQKRVRGRDCPWITGQIKREIRHRDFLLKKARKSKLDEDWLAYRTVRNRVSNIVRRAKQTYNKKLIKDHQDDSKTFWKTMKKILPGEKKSSVIKNIQVDGKLCTNNKKIANAFNMFFTSAVTRLN